MIVDLVLGPGKLVDGRYVYPQRFTRVERLPA